MAFPPRGQPWRDALKALLTALALWFTVASADDGLLISPMDLLFSGDTLLGKRGRVEGQKWYGASYRSAMSSIEANGDAVAPLIIDLNGVPANEKRQIVETCSSVFEQPETGREYTVEGTRVSISETGVRLKDVRLIPAN